MSIELGAADVPGAVGAPLALLAVLAEHPELGQGVQRLGNVLLHGGVLRAADRELLILRVAASIGAPYVERGHLPMAACAGLTPGQLDRICKRLAGDRAALSSRQFALLRACHELIRYGTLRPSTRLELAGGNALDTAELMEIAAVVGFYVMIAWITRVFNLQPEA